MKRNNFIYLCIRCMILVVGIIAFAGCHRVGQFTGDYSYKLSGEVRFYDADGDVKYVAMSQRGQLNVLKDHNGNAKEVIVTVNVLDGASYTFTGSVKGDSIFFDEHEFLTEFTTIDADLDLNQVHRAYRITASGKGILNDGILIMEEQWRGNRVDGEPNTLRADKITLIAEQN